MTAAVELKDATAGYRGEMALRGIDLSIGHGRVTGIAGPNGSGKTTLLKLILGLVPLQAGSAKVLGLDLSSSNMKVIRTRTACVFQLLETDPRMPVSAWDVVMMGRYGRIGILKSPGYEDRRAVAEALDRTGASHLAGRPFGHLSGGERQRVNIARALAQQPDLLLLDEPTTFLDSGADERVREIVSRIHRETGITILIVSHDAGMLQNLCRDIVWMKDGAVAEVVSGA